MIRLLRTLPMLVLLVLVGACGKSPLPADGAPAVPVVHAPATPTGEPPASAAQGQDEPPPGVLRAYVWSCSDGQKLVMRNLFREKAIALDLHDGTRRLDQTTSASGARYADAVAVFWTKGSTATFERKGAPSVQCQEMRDESLRADARLRDAH